MMSATTASRSTTQARPSASRRHQTRVNCAAAIPRAAIRVARGAAAGVLAVSLLAAPALAAKENALVGEFQASGTFFKDSVEIISFSDPKVDGVTLYISDFKRSLSAKLQKDFFSEPSSASITCAASGALVPTVDLDSLKPEGEEVYKERKNLSLSSKTLRVRRLFDKENQTLVYVAYSTRLNGEGDSPELSAGRYKTSLCAVPLGAAGKTGNTPTEQ